MLLLLLSSRSRSLSSLSSSSSKSTSSITDRLGFAEASEAGGGREAAGANGSLRSSAPEVIHAEGERLADDWRGRKYDERTCIVCPTATTEPRISTRSLGVLVKPFLSNEIKNFDHFDHFDTSTKASSTPSERTFNWSISTSAYEGV